MSKPKLSVVLATKNEEKNIGNCLKSVTNIADEIIIFDEESDDRTRNIAREYGAKVFNVKHEAIFHKTKQKALETAKHGWILQLDADERVTQELAKEIKQAIEMSNSDIKKRRPRSKKAEKLFNRHQKIIEERDGKIGKDSGEVVAFFLPRLNFFLGKPLIHAGVYPDANIRLVKKDKARFPSKSVHEQMEIDGEVAWLFNDLEHYDSPTLQRYFERANRYTTLTAEEYKNEKLPRNILFLIHYSFFKPLIVFLKLYVRHLGFLDGARGFIWSFFSALHFPVAYIKYLQMGKK